MNTFERELRKLFDHDSVLTDTKFIGRACYGKLFNNVNAKIEFVTHGTHEKYEGLKTTLININSGAIDQSLLLFNDFIGPYYNSNDSYTSGVPYLWNYDGKIKWHKYQPTESDYDKISALVNDYLGMFRGQVQVMTENEVQVQSMSQNL